MGRAVAVIIGAGPAGLTAAYELLTRTGVRPIVLERDGQVGGIARTVNYHGNRLDVGGHRFFSKSDRVMDWWLRMLPLEGCPAGRIDLVYQGRRRPVATDSAGPDPATTDRVMLLRRRKSRIYFLGKFFDYPLRLDADTLRKLGLWRVGRMAASYLWACAWPYRPPKNLEQFFINRFGRQLYRTFFKDYTEKVWGQPCTAMSPAWGAQRIKGLSLGKAAGHYLRSLTGRGRPGRPEETSLIEYFLYPKFGPGQMWEVTAEEVRRLGGEVLLNHEVTGLTIEGRRVVGVEARDLAAGGSVSVPAEFVFSTMPVERLIPALGTAVPAAVREIAESLEYRDFITVGLLAREVALRDPQHPERSLVDDNWIYLQEPRIRAGRLQIFNNWSPYMVADPERPWIGVEYFGTQGDEIWRQSDAAVAELAVAEMARVGVLKPQSVLDATVLRMPRAYPSYSGSYERFGELRAWIDGLENLCLLGRNGMHRYNNQDHSMLTAMVAVDGVASGQIDKARLWAVNTEPEYQEGGLGGGMSNDE